MFAQVLNRPSLLRYRGTPMIAHLQLPEFSVRRRLGQVRLVTELRRGVRELALRVGARSPGAGERLHISMFVDET